MDLTKFRLAVQQYRHFSQTSQSELAATLGIQLSVLSRKLSGSGNARLTHPEIKQIVKTLAEREAFSTKAGAIELLELAGLQANSFSLDEWQSSPLDRLEISSPPKGGAVATSPLTRPRPLKLPTPITPLVGRQAEAEQICSWLQQDGVRLISLLGPGGTGKTRLALKVAAECMARFEDGIFFVGLANLTNPAMVVPTITHALAIPNTSKQALEISLLEYLSDKRVLLVLDNFEQVLEAASIVTSLLTNAAGLKILVTSRRVLDLYGERQFQVQPLSLPDLAQLPSAQADLLQFEAVALFVVRAQNYRSGFELTKGNYAAVAQIVTLLDGLPLALELAAAQIKLWSPQQLWEKLLKQGLKPLTHTVRDLPARQQTMYNTLEWSYALLTEPEKILLCQLAVFPRSWTLEAAESVCTGGEVVALVERLANHSLVKISQEASNQSQRFFLLETIRQYALEKLIASGDIEIWERAVQYLKLRGQELEAIDNNQAYLYYVDAFQALAYLPPISLNYKHWFVDLLLGLVSFTTTSPERHKLIGELKQAEQIMQDLLTAPSMDNMDNKANQLRLAWVWYWLADLCWNTANFTEVDNYLQSALNLAHAIDEDDLISLAVLFKVRVLMIRGFYLDALTLLTRVVQTLPKHKYWFDWVTALAFQGQLLASTGQYQAGEASIEQALAEATRLNSLSRQGYAYLCMAGAHFYSGDAPAVLAACQVGVTFSQRSHEHFNTALFWTLQSWAECKTGNSAAAQEYLEKTLDLHRIINLIGSDFNFALLANVWLELGEPERAMALAQEALVQAKKIDGIRGSGLAHWVCGQALKQLGTATPQAVEEQLVLAEQDFNRSGMKFMQLMTQSGPQLSEDDKFSFGLETVGNRGRDPFGDFV